MIQKADHLLAEAFRTIVALYKDKILEKPEGYASAFPDLLTFQDAATVIEQRLFEMHLKHRMRTFQGAFHSNPDYTFWYGWSEMVRDLTDIKTMALRCVKRNGFYNYFSKKNKNYLNHKKRDLKDPVSQLNIYRIRFIFNDFVKEPAFIR